MQSLMTLALKLFFLLIVVGSVVFVTNQTLRDNQNRASIERGVQPGASPWSAPVGMRPPTETTRQRH